MALDTVSGLVELVELVDRPPTAAKVFLSDLAGRVGDRVVTHGWVERVRRSRRSIAQRRPLCALRSDRTSHSKRARTRASGWSL